MTSHGDGATAAGSLLERLQRESDDAVRACRDTAETEARDMLDAAQRRLAGLRQLTLTVRARQYAAECTAARTRTQQRVARDTLHARAEAINRVLQTAIDNAGQLVSHPEFDHVVETDLARALPFMPDGQVVVKCPELLASVVRAVAARLDPERIRIDVDNTVLPGMVVQSSDGHVFCDLTFSRRITSARPRLAIRTVQLLNEVSP